MAANSMKLSYTQSVGAKCIYTRAASCKHPVCVSVCISVGLTNAICGAHKKCNDFSGKGNERKSETKTLNKVTF